MAKTAAERQRDYRARRGEAGENGERRLNLWVPTSTFLIIDRLAALHGITKRKMLEDLLMKEEEKVTKKMTEEQFDAYIGGVPTLQKESPAV